MADMDNEQATRLLRRKNVIKKGIDPYPARIVRSHSCRAFLADFEKLLSDGQLITLVGRVRSIRLHGGSCFAHIQDGTDKVQIFLQRDGLGEEQYDTFIKTLDVGDFLEAAGKPYLTKRGEKSLLVERFRLISKSLNPLPEKWHGLSDVEIRYRKRYLDLLSNPEVKSIFLKRHALIRTLRSFLEDERFIEVETPILQTMAGGALAEPFITHHNALGADLFLRVAPELFLKRLIIGGFERVFEIARCFRNEGIDHLHNPEFTQVELYAAYMDYFELMAFTERMMVALVHSVRGDFMVPYEGNQLNFTPPYRRLTFRDAILEYAKFDIDNYPNEKKLASELSKRNIVTEKKWNRAKMLDEAIKNFVRPYLIQPAFLYRYPIELSPLAKKTENDTRYVERFQLFAGGKELANAFSEINDPTDQQDRFDDQEKNRKRGDNEAHHSDADFIEALTYGMPPTAGLGMGIDRLTNILTDTHSIKEVILFPTLKPQTQ